MRKIIKICLLCCFITLIVSGCSMVEPTNSVTKNSQVININTTNEDVYNGQWTLISRARFVQGTVVSLENSSNDTSILSLKVEVNFHDGTDSVDNKDFPFKVGEVVRFVLKSKPSVDVSNGKRIIIYEGQVTVNNKDNFIGAKIKYYEDKGKFHDLSGNEITLPPKDYPSDNTLSIKNLLDLSC